MGATGCAGIGASAHPYAEQEMAVVPTGAHDATLDWIVTPKEAIRCRVEGLRGRS
jgi:hypothetical protein